MSTDKQSPDSRPTRTRAGREFCAGLTIRVALFLVGCARYVFHDALTFGQRIQGATKQWTARGN
jgi:hypothetical protein